MSRIFFIITLLIINLFVYAQPKSLQHFGIHLDGNVSLNNELHFGSGIFYSIKPLKKLGFSIGLKANGAWDYSYNEKDGVELEYSGGNYYQLYFSANYFLICDTEVAMPFLTFETGNYWTKYNISYKKGAPINDSMNDTNTKEEFLLIRPDWYGALKIGLCFFFQEEKQHNATIYVGYSTVSPFMPLYFEIIQDNGFTPSYSKGTIQLGLTYGFDISRRKPKKDKNRPSMW